MRTFFVAWAVASLLVACADAEVPRNQATLDTCQGVTAPDGTQLQCLHGSQICPLPWKGVHACIDQVDDAVCMTPPCPLGGAKKPGLTPAHQAPSDAGAPVIGAGYADAGWGPAR